MIQKIKFSDLTEQQRKTYREIWVEVLDKYCPADGVGNRPCDWGAYCERCHYDLTIQNDFKEQVKNDMHIEIVK